MGGLYVPSGNHAAVPLYAPGTEVSSVLDMCGGGLLSSYCLYGRIQRLLTGYTTNCSFREGYSSTVVPLKTPVPHGQSAAYTKASYKNNQV